MKDQDQILAQIIDLLRKAAVEIERDPGAKAAIAAAAGIDQASVLLTPAVKLTKDAARAIAIGQMPNVEKMGAVGQTINASEARVLVDLYYSAQDQRKAIVNQILAIDRGADAGATHGMADFVSAQVENTEDNAKMMLAAFAGEHQMWPWFDAVSGIGPVLAAGLIAHFGSRPLPPTVGHWWRFAGLDPSQRWIGAEEAKAMWGETEGDIDLRARTIAILIGRSPDTVIRDATIDYKTGEEKALTKAGAVKSLCRIPFNRPLKTLCWKVGDQFVKLGSRQDAFYAVYYRNRKAAEIARNESGGRAELAAKTLAERPNHAQKAIYAAGKLPDGRVDLMARRATVKLFLSHMHEIWWRATNDGAMPPRPFATQIAGHAHYIAPPHLEAMGLK